MWKHIKDYVFASECKNYKSLTDSTRKLFFSTNSAIRGTLRNHDKLGFPQNSVDWKGEAWYRVMGNAGTRIPEYPFTSVQVGDLVYCQTWCPRYLSKGSHPQTPGELVYNVTVCYNCLGPICNYVHNYVKIVNCGDFFVYYLTAEFPYNYIIHMMSYCTE